MLSPCSSSTTWSSQKNWAQSTFGWHFLWGNQLVLKYVQDIELWNKLQIKFPSNKKLPTTTFGHTSTISNSLINSVPPSQHRTASTMLFETSQNLAFIQKPCPDTKIKLSFLLLQNLNSKSNATSTNPSFYESIWRSLNNNHGRASLQQNLKKLFSNIPLL
jgi:hypothetical protein